MRKVLLGTTALVAAGFVASAAVADDMAEPISVGIGGYYRVAIGNVDGSNGIGQPEQNNHRVAFGEDSELNISGSTTLDNDITVGVSINLEGSRGGNAGAGADEAHVSFEGAFGRIQLGNLESARQQKVTFAPQGTSNFGVNSPFFTFAANSWLATYEDGIGNEDSMKLVYMTPSFNGFQLGLSYAPDDNTHGQYGGNTSNDAGQYENQVGVGLSFAQDFAGGSLSISAGYESYDAETPDGMSCATLVDHDGDEALIAAVAAAYDLYGVTHNGGPEPTPRQPLIDNCEPETVQAGATMGFGAFTVGGGWMEVDTSDNTVRTVADFGASWSDGPMTLGVVYGSSESEVTGMSDAVIERFALGGTYVLGPGVDIQAQLDFGENDAAGPKNLAEDNEWVQFMIGSAVTF